jgi:quinol monooxygenase YgiN
MIIVSGVVQARPDTFDEVRSLCVEHVARSRTEPGCLEHGVAIDVHDDLRLVFFERWTDRAALDAHFAAPASTAFVEKVVKLAAQPPRMHLYQADGIRRPGQEG